LENLKVKKELFMKWSFCLNVETTFVLKLTLSKWKAYLTKIYQLLRLKIKVFGLWIRYLSPWIEPSWELHHVVQINSCTKSKSISCCDCKNLKHILGIKSFIYVVFVRNHNCSQMAVLFPKTDMRYFLTNSF